MPGTKNQVFTWQIIFCSLVNTRGMARMMSMYVDFNEHNYMALVVVHQKYGKDEFCEVSFIDKDLQLILSDEMLVFDMKNELKALDQPSNQLAAKLVARTIEALQNRIGIDYIKHD